MIDLFKKNFNELSKELDDKLTASGVSHFFGAIADDEKAKRFLQNTITDSFFIGWTQRAKNLIANACGENSMYFKDFERASRSNEGESSFVIARRLYSLFNATKSDYIKGYARPIESIIRAELFSDELEQAEELLKSGYLIPAAVVAGIVLETTIKGICEDNSIAKGKVESMSVALTKCDFHTLNDQKKITYLYGLRNSAAHGDKNFTQQDVESMISDVRSYINKYVN